MSKLIKGIHHIELECHTLENYEETVKFYKEVLGLEVLRSWGEGTDAGIMLSAGNCLIEIFAEGEKLPQGTIKHFAFATDDVAACLDAVRKAGYRVIREAMDHVIPSDPACPITFGFCIGPVGEVIEFLAER